MKERDVFQKETVLKVENLTKVFRIGGIRKKKIYAVNGISFEINRKEILALVGESGSGKTTVAKIIARLYKPTSGKIFLESKEIPDKLTKKELLMYRRSIQMIFQDPFSSLNPLYPVRYAVERPIKVHKLAKGKEIKTIIKKAFEECGLIPAERFMDKYPHELSGGERQRVNIARALVLKPKLILADEPTSMLDVSIRLDIMNLMLDLKENEGISYLFITHDLAGANYISDRIAIMYSGCILEIGPSSDVIDDPKHPYTQLLKKAAPKPETGLRPERIDTNVDIPDLTKPPKGCPFAPRCPSAQPECKISMPEFKKVGNDHFVRCYIYY